MKNIDLQPGDRFAHFVIVRLLGQGGMGRVFEAEHEFTHRRTALKLILEHLVDQDMRERMIQEARALAGLDHPNIVRLYDANITDGTIWLAMEYLPGKTLRAYRNATGPVPLSQALHLLIETCDGVAAAHEIGIVHRDLKPENILLTEQNVTKVLDFGAAKFVRGEKARTTAIGAGGKRRIIGTPEYMSPEHLRGDRVDDRTDSYALGVIAMELLWDHPFRNPDGSMPEVYELVRRQFVEPPPHLRQVAPHLPDEVADLLDRALSKHAAARPSVADMAATLRTVRTSYTADPGVDRAPFAKQWTGAGAWVVNGPAVSLPQHVPAPKEPSRSVVVQVPGGATVSEAAAPKTQRLIPAPATATVELVPPQPTPVLSTPEAMTMMPATVGPDQRGSQPAQLRARRARVAILAACCVAGIAAGVVVLTGTSNEPAGAVGSPPSPEPASATPPLPASPANSQDPQSAPAEPSSAEPASPQPEPASAEPASAATPPVTASAKPAGAAPKTKTATTNTNTASAKSAPAGSSLSLPFAGRAPQAK